MTFLTINILRQSSKVYSINIYVQILEEETREVLKKNPGSSVASNLDVYFDKMKEIIAEKKASSRVRFLMQDVIDLRTAN